MSDDELIKSLEKFGRKAGNQNCNEYLVAWHNEKPMVWLLDSHCRPQYYDEEIKKDIFAIGACQPLTHYLISSLRDRNKRHTLAQGTLIAYRLVRQTIKLSPLVGPPIDVWTVAKNQPPKKKSPEQLKELEFLYNRWVEGERLIADGILSSL